MNSRLARNIATKTLLAGLTVGIGLSVWGSAWAQGGGSGGSGGFSGNGLSIYTCVDKNGRKLTSDRPIPECVDREQRELGPSGTVRRVLGPTLTENERAAQVAKQRKEQEERHRIIEERRRERAITARYPDKASHDIERAVAIELIDGASLAATQHIQALRDQRVKLDVEMEFYRLNPNKAPMTLRRQIAENEENIQERQRFLGTQAQEKRRIHQRFDLELSQLQRLWAEQQMLPTTTGAPENDPVFVPPGR